MQRGNEDASKMATNVEMNVHQGTAKVTDPSEGALGICSDSIMDKNVWPVSMMVFNALNFPHSVTFDVCGKQGKHEMRQHSSCSGSACL